jgi:hypothetical protein
VFICYVMVLTSLSRLGLRHVRVTALYTTYTKCSLTYLTINFKSVLNDQRPVSSMRTRRHRADTSSLQSFISKGDIYDRLIYY